MRAQKIIQMLVLSVWIAIQPEPDLLAQNLVWEKEWGFQPGSEQIYKVCPTQDGNFFAFGSSSKFMQTFWGSQYHFPLIIKINADGDTLFMKRIEVLNSSLNFIGHKYGDVYQAVFTTPLPGFTRCPVIVEFTGNGIILETKIFTQLTGYYLSEGIRTPDLGLLFTGTGIGPGTNMCGFKFNFLNELEWANAFFPPAQVPGFGRRVEPMANGNYLVSGYMGRRIYGFEIDSAGNQIAQKQFYETPSNNVFWDAKAHQGFDKGSFSSGYYLDNNMNRKDAFFFHDSLGNKIWGGESTNGIGPTFLTREKTLIISGWEPGSRHIRRIKQDSSEIWKVNLGAGNNNPKVINDLIFTQNDTGIIVGTHIYSQGNVGYQFYIAKIAGVGTAYDPTDPDDTVFVSAKERLFRPKDTPILYPNPVCEAFQFSKLTEESLLAIYSIKGEKLFEKSITPGEKIKAGNLPKGLYLYHIRMGKRVFTGKMIKD
jgi:hypothetical protein